METKVITFTAFEAFIWEKKIEGFVFMGAGGDLNDWIQGVSKLLKEEGIAEVGDPDELFTDAFKLTTSGGRIDLALIFNNESKGLNIGKLAIWRLNFGSASWISDYLVNYAAQHNT